MLLSEDACQVGQTLIHQNTAFPVYKDIDAGSEWLQSSWVQLWKAESEDSQEETNHWECGENRSLWRRVRKIYAYF